MLLDEIKQWVFARNKNLKDSRSYLALLKEFEKEWSMHSVINEVLNSEALFKELESRAFYHPLGVLKLPLYNANKNEPELRIHIYEKPNENVDDTYEEAHDHKWDLCSCILSGTFKFTQLEASSYGSEFSLVDMKSDGVGSKRNTVSSGTILLDEKFVALLSSGDYYYFEHGNIHNFIPVGNGVHSTLIVRGPYLLESTKLFESSESGRNRAFSGSTQRAEPVNIREQLLKLQNKLNRV